LEVVPDSHMVNAQTRQFEVPFGNGVSAECADTDSMGDGGVGGTSDTPFVVDPFKHHWLTENARYSHLHAPHVFVGNELRQKSFQCGPRVPQTDAAR
jgi:hypothetical protein